MRADQEFSITVLLSCGNVLIAFLMVTDKSFMAILQCSYNFIFQVVIDNKWNMSNTYSLQVCICWEAIVGDVYEGWKVIN